MIAIMETESTNGKSRNWRTSTSNTWLDRGIADYTVQVIRNHSDLCIIRVSIVFNLIVILCFPVEISDLTSDSGNGLVHPGIPCHSHQTSCCWSGYSSPLVLVR